MAKDKSQAKAAIESRALDRVLNSDVRDTAVYCYLPSSSSDTIFRILHVCNDLGTRQALTLGVGFYGFEVVCVAHGIDAIMQFRGQEGNFGSILIDHEWPDINGAAFAAFARSFGFKGCIVLASGYFCPSYLRAYQNCGISGILTKPFDIELLATLLLQPE